MDWFAWLRLALGDITALIQALARVLISIGNFVADIVKEMVTTVKLLDSAGSHVGGLIGGWLPPAVVSVVISTFTVVVLYKIFGREG